MNPSSPVHKEFEEIRQTGDFKRLHSYRDPSSWLTLSASERETLAQLFLIAGKTELKEGSEEAMRHFEWAEQLVPENRYLLCRIAEAYLLRPQSVGCLRSAQQLLERILERFPDHFEVRALLAKTLMLLGVATEESNLLQTAQVYYRHAEELAEQQGDQEQLINIWWGWANALTAQANLSGEAVDLHHALTLYRKATKEQPQQINFWIDYSQSLWRLKRLIGDQGELLMEEGLLCCDSLLTIAGDHPIAYYHMARWWQSNYESTWQQEAFEKARIYFEAVTAIKVQHPSFWAEHGTSYWYDWGRLLSLAGKWNRDFSLLEKAGDKFEQAFLLSEDQPHLLNGWAEVLILSGSESEHYELLREAEQKLIKSIELQRDIPRSWTLLGQCLYELGRYFSDERYFVQAEEKFQFALQLHPNHPEALYGLALIHYMLGETWNDLSVLEKSTEEYMLAFQSGAGHHPQFWSDWGVSCLKIGELVNSRQFVELALEKFEYALTCYKNSGDDHPHPEWLYHYGCALDFLGDLTSEVSCYERAVDILSIALELSDYASHVRFNLALAYAHLGESAEDYDSFCKACEQFQALALEESEDEHLWNEWGVALINMAQLVYDPIHPLKAHELYQLAEAKLQQAIALGCQAALYHLACCYSLSGNFLAAMEYIERADHYSTLPSLQDLLHDEWLEPLRHTTQFQQYLNLLAHRQRNRDANPS